MIPFVACEESK
jgi:hypothetical protein